eukprot:TRINITY_DN497_c0_g3_i1.p1 TRINITY_DN497_c0_g3~~TRINITY_DN497_c0_g3_i1.p1  ORF type:complete len:499 (-),score=29.24 TRINITY_DN497_c0_g3_i1:77-1429(-)
MKGIEIDLAGTHCRKIIRWRVPIFFKLLAFVIFLSSLLFEVFTFSFLIVDDGPLGNGNFALGILCACIEFALLMVAPLAMICYDDWEECKCCENILSFSYTKGLKALKEFVIIATPIYLSFFLRILYFIVNRENKYVLTLFITVIVKFVSCFSYTILPTLKLINYIVIYIFMKNDAWAFTWSACLHLSFNPDRPSVNASCYFCHDVVLNKILCFSKKRAFHVECARRYFTHEQNIENILRFMGISMWITSGSTIKIYAEHVSANLFIKAHGRLKAVSGNLLHFNEKDQLEIVDVTTNEIMTNIRYGKTLVNHLLCPNGKSTPTYNLIIKNVVYHSQDKQKNLSKYNQKQRKSYEVPLKAPVFLVDDRYFIKVHKERNEASLKMFDLCDEENGVESVEVPREYRNEVFITEKLKVVKPGLVQVGEELVLDINERRVRAPALYEDVNIIVIS